MAKQNEEDFSIAIAHIVYHQIDSGGDNKPEEYYINIAINVGVRPEFASNMVKMANDGFGVLLEVLESEGEEADAVKRLVAMGMEKKMAQLVIKGCLQGLIEWNNSDTKS